MHLRSIVATAAVVVAVALMSFGSVQLAAGFYVPSVPRNLYARGDNINVRVNSLRSRNELVPYNFYHLPFCKPSPSPQAIQESLGEILYGDDMMSSSYDIQMMKNVTCKKVSPCLKNKDDVKAKLTELEKFIEEGYRGHMSVDNLPGYNPGQFMFNGRCSASISVEKQSLYRRGFAIGVPKTCTGYTLLNNHLEFRVKYHVSEPDATDKKKYSIVGFTITPQSVAYSSAEAAGCSELFVSPSDERNGRSVTPLKISDVRSGQAPVVWTYSVQWVPSDMPWALRWDSYLSTSFADSNARIHWDYIVISMLLALVISAAVTFILMRTLKMDCNKINSDDPEERQEEVGWKYVHSDVFRQPDFLNLLAIFVGNGIQLLLTLVVILFIALFGFLSPANRGGLLTTGILMFVLMSFPAGYVCAMVQKMFDIKEWKTVFGCALIFPGELFIVWLIQDLISAAMGASNSVPFATFLGLFVLWLLIATPLTVLGASFAWHQDKVEFPVEVGKMAREIPVQRWYYAPPFSLIVPGFVPFMIVFLELKFIFNSIWLGYVYYVFGFLAIVITLWAYTVGLTAVVMIYYQLAYEDWRWWWRSFFVPSGCGVYVILYAIYFYNDQLNVQSKAGTFLYFCYTFLFAVAYVLVAGAIGFISCLLFTRKIYGSIRID